MADEVVEAGDVESSGGSKRKKNLMMIGILLAVMIVEGVAVFVLVKKFGPQPQTAEAGAVDGLNPEEGEAALGEAEVEVAHFRAQNEQARQVVVWDVTIFATVPKAREQEFADLVASKNATIQDRLSSVVRSADPAVLMEPDPATLRQQFKQELAAIVEDPDLIQGVLIPSIVSYRE